MLWNRKDLARFSPDRSLEQPNVLLNRLVSQFEPIKMLLFNLACKEKKISLMKLLCFLSNFCFCDHIKFIFSKKATKFAWIRGDLEHTDRDDFFVSEDESEKRILLILKIFSTILLMVSSILAVQCFNNSSFSMKIKVIHLSKGKYSDKL